MSKYCGLRSSSGTNSTLLDTVHTYQREGTGTERVCPPLIQVVSVVLRLDTDGLGADAINEPCIK